MGAYQLSLHGTLHGSDAQSDGSSRGSSNGGNRSSRGGKETDNSPKGGRHNNFFQSRRVPSLCTPPRRSTACCDGLSDRREIGRGLSAIVPPQDFHCMGHSFRSEDSASLALWEEKEQPASKLTTQSPRWLDAVRKFDTMKLAPWRSSPVHPKAPFDGQRLSLSDRKGSMKSFHEAPKAPWYTSVTTQIVNGESRSVRSPPGASNWSRRSGELISSRAELVVKKEWLVNGVTGSGIPADGTNAVQTEGPREKVTENATPLKLETTNTESVIDNKSASRDSAVKELKAMETSTSEVDRVSNKTSAVHEKEEISALGPIKGEATVPYKMEEAPGDDTPANEVTSCKASQPSPRLATPSLEQDDDTSPYKALRQRCILKLESEPLDGNLYLLQPRAQSVITNPKDEEADMSLASCLLKSMSSSRVEASSTPERLLASLRNKVFRSTRPSPSPKKKNLGDLLESSSPRSILCGLADEGSLPSSNPSLRFDPGMPPFSFLPTPASQSYSSSGASFDPNDHDFEVTRSAYNLRAPKAVESLRMSLSSRDFGPSLPSRGNAASKVDASVKAIPNTELLGCKDQLNINDGRSSPERILTSDLWTATVFTNVQTSRTQPDSPCAITERESACSPCENTPPATRHSYVSPSESEERRMSSVVSRSRPRHNDFTARLGGMFTSRRLLSKCDDGVFSSHHNCCVASGPLSPPYDNNRSLAYDSAKEWKSKSKSQFSNRRHSSADSSDAPTMMISISKAMRKILSKCTVKRSNSTRKSKMESPVLDTLPPADSLQRGKMKNGNI